MEVLRVKVLIDLGNGFPRLDGYCSEVGILNVEGVVDRGGDIGKQVYELVKNAIDVYDKRSDEQDEYDKLRDEELQKDKVFKESDERYEASK